jgi:tetratricopeptide (TPR) repeat protein
VRVDLGKVQEAREDWAAAEASYQAALDQLPTFFEAAVALAELHRRTGAPRKAIHLLADVLTADSTAIEALLVLGKALLEDGRVDQALHSFERVLTHDQHHLPALFFSGVVFARQRRYQQAVERWDRVIDLDPSGPYAHRARKHARTALDLRHIFEGEVA